MTLLQLNLSVNRDKLPVGRPARVYAKLEIRPTKEAEEMVKAQERRLHLVFCIDSSASMFGDKLENAKKAALWRFKRDLNHPDDLISIVTFDDTARIILENVKKGHGENDKRVEDAIGRIVVGNYTNLYDGLKTCIELAKKSPRHYVKRIILITDGMPTAGNTNPADIVALAKAAYDEGILTFVYGIGDDYDLQLCDAIAKSGGGWLRHIVNPGDIEKYTAVGTRRDKLTVIDALKLNVSLDKDAAIENAYVVIPSIKPLEKCAGQCTWPIGSLTASGSIIVAMEIAAQSQQPGRKKIAEFTVGGGTATLEVEFVSETQTFTENNPIPRLYLQVAHIVTKIDEKIKAGQNYLEELEILKKIYEDQRIQQTALHDLYLFAIIQRHLPAITEHTKIDQGTRIDPRKFRDQLTNLTGQ